jgi:hypothetical protein
LKVPGQKITNTFVGVGVGLNIPFSNSIKLKTELYVSSGSKATYIGIMGAFQFSF